jgi:hypothetical protein
MTQDLYDASCKWARAAFISRYEKAEEWKRSGGPETKDPPGMYAAQVAMQTKIAQGKLDRRVKEIVAAERAMCPPPCKFFFYTDEIFFSDACEEVVSLPGEMLEHWNHLTIVTAKTLVHTVCAPVEDPTSKPPPGGQPADKTEPEKPKEEVVKPPEPPAGPPPAAQAPPAEAQAPPAAQAHPPEAQSPPAAQAPPAGPCGFFEKTLLRTVEGRWKHKSSTTVAIPPSGDPATIVVWEKTIYNEFETIGRCPLRLGHAGDHVPKATVREIARSVTQEESYPYSDRNPKPPKGLGLPEIQD